MKYTVNAKFKGTIENFNKPIDNVFHYETEDRGEVKNLVEALSKFCGFSDDHRVCIIVYDFPDGSETATISER